MHPSQAAMRDHGIAVTGRLSVAQRIMERIHVKVGQDTFYLKKFNVQGSNLYKHQYMTNIQAAAVEGAKLAEAYGTALKQSSWNLRFRFTIICHLRPVQKPVTDGSPNNKLSGLGVDGFALTPQPSKVDVTSYDLIVNPSVQK